MGRLYQSRVVDGGVHSNVDVDGPREFNAVVVCLQASKLCGYPNVRVCGLRR